MPRGDKCARCGGDLPKHPVMEGAYFCSVECADAAKIERDFEARKEDIEPKVKAILKEELMGYLAAPVPVPVFHIKCQRVDCIHNYGHWCYREGRAIGLNEEGTCLSYSLT